MYSVASFQQPINQVQVNNGGFNSQSLNLTNDFAFNTVFAPSFDFAPPAFPPVFGPPPQLLPPFPPGGGIGGGFPGEGGSVNIVSILLALLNGGNSGKPSGSSGGFGGIFVLLALLLGLGSKGGQAYDEPAPPQPRAHVHARQQDPQAHPDRQDHRDLPAPQGLPDLPAIPLIRPRHHRHHEMARLGAIPITPLC